MSVFGTDGIRALAGRYPLNISFLEQLVPAIITTFQAHKVVIARDTRLSGQMLNGAISSLLAAYGIDVYDAGIMPTPSIPCLIHSLNADLGIVISASHNSFEDNGIKIFDKNGYKLTRQQEREIENNLNIQLQYQVGANIGRISAPSCKMTYIESINKIISKKIPTGTKYKVALDAANGAMSEIARDVLKPISASLVTTACEPNGININANCGVVHPEHISQVVKNTNSDLGIAFDGDGDRLLVCDEYGVPVHGDHLLGFLAQSYGQRIRSVVLTVMSNLGLELFLKSIGKSVLRTPVGDKFIAHEIIKGAAQFGGETSGHIILGDYSTTGDGLLAAIAVLAALERQDQPPSIALRPFDLIPFVQNNIAVRDKNILDTSQQVHDIVKQYQSEDIRIVLRKSGTENLIRLLVEGKDIDKITDISKIIETKILEA